MTKYRALIAILSISAFVMSTMPVHAAAITVAPHAASTPSTSSDGQSIRAGVEIVAATSTVSLSEDINTPRERLILVSAKKPTRNINMFTFDLKNEGPGSTALVQSLNLSVSTTTVAQSPAANITGIVSKATIFAGGRLYTGTINSNNTISFSFSRPVQVPKNNSQAFIVSIDVLGQKGNYSDSGESLTFNEDSNSIVATDSKSGGLDHIVGSAYGYTQFLTSIPGINVYGKDSSSVLTYNSANPSQSYGTFIIDYTITSVGSDIYIPRTVSSTTSASSTAGTVLNLNMDTFVTGTSSVSIASTADVYNQSFWVVQDGDTATFTATVYIDPNSTGDFEVGLDLVRFSTGPDINHLQTLNIDERDSQFHTPPLHIPNS